MQPGPFFPGGGGRVLGGPIRDGDGAVRRASVLGQRPKTLMPGAIHLPPADMIPPVRLPARPAATGSDAPPAAQEKAIEAAKAMQDEEN